MSWRKVNIWLFSQYIAYSIHRTDARKHTIKTLPNAWKDNICWILPSKLNRNCLGSYKIDMSSGLVNIKLWLSSLYHFYLLTYHHLVFSHQMVRCRKQHKLRWYKKMKLIWEPTLTWLWKLWAGEGLCYNSNGLYFKLILPGNNPPKFSYFKKFSSWRERHY